VLGARSAQQNTKTRPQGQEFTVKDLKIVPVRKHQRSPRGAKEAALAELLNRGLREDVAKQVIKVATARLALKSFDWAFGSVERVYRNLRRSRLARSSNIAYYLLHAIWKQTIQDAKGTGFSDTQWCKNEDFYLRHNGLRLPFPTGTRADNLRVLRGAKMLLAETL
jgi:hypothetical protein